MYNVYCIFHREASLYLSYRPVVTAYTIPHVSQAYSFRFLKPCISATPVVYCDCRISPSCLMKILSVACRRFGFVFPIASSVPVHSTNSGSVLLRSTQTPFTSAAS